MAPSHPTASAAEAGGDATPRVLLACGWPRALGALVHAGRLASALATVGVDVCPLASQPDHDPLIEAGIRAVPVDVAPGQDSWHGAIASRRALLDAAESAGPRDIGHAEDPVGAAALIDLRQQGRLKAVVTTVHHVATHERREFEDLQRHAIQQADVTICASHWWADVIASEFGVAARVVPHGVEHARFAHFPDDRATAGAAFGWGTRPAVLALGGIQPRKGSRELLEAFARARARLGEGALLVIAGPAEHPEFRTRWEEDAERLGLRVHRGGMPGEDVDVVELGGLPAPEMPRLMRACDVLASPSRREGFGLAAIEAAAAGVPNVLSDLPVFREHFTDRRTCMMVPVGDTRALATALVRILRDAPLRDGIVTQAGRLARDFDWPECARAHAAIYRELVG